MNGIALAALGMIAALAPLPATAADAPLYSVRFRMEGVETRGGDPSLTAREGEQATVMIGNDSYALRIVTTTDADRRVDVNAEASVWTPSGLRHVHDEVALTANGETGTFAFTATDPATGESRPIRIEFSVVPLAD